jgi:hypothetical protein
VRSDVCETTEFEREKLDLSLSNLGTSCGISASPDAALGFARAFAAANNARMAASA